MDDQHGHYSAAPDYYGMLAFAPAAAGELLAVDYDAAGLSATAYAVKHHDKVLVTIINKDRSRTAEAHISAGKSFPRAAAVRLSGPSLDSRTGTTLGASSLDASGIWHVAETEPIRLQNGELSIHVPAASAALVTLEQ